MIVRCKNCNYEVVYDIKTKRFRCSHCDSRYDIDEIEEQVNNANNKDSSEYMETEIHRCTSCGAEPKMNSNNPSINCLFCGQPTVASEGLEKRKRPDYIIPFSVTWEQVMSRVEWHVDGIEYKVLGEKNVK